MFRMLLRSRRYAGQFFKRRSWDLSTPPKVPNPYGAGYSGAEEATGEAHKLKGGNRRMLVAQTKAILTKDTLLWRPAPERSNG